MAKKLTQKFNKSELKRLVDDKNSCVSVQKSVYNLQLYPYHLTDISASIKEIINAKVAKYDQKLDGILLGYANLKLLTPQGSIMSDSCFIHIDIEGEFYLFKPEVNSLLTGVVNKKSVDHVGCLVHQLFNISVPSTEENWIGKEVSVGDEVVVKIVYMDLDSRLPYFKAELIEIKTKNKKKIKQVAEDDLGYQTEDISPKKKNKRHKIKLENSTQEYNTVDEKDTSLKKIKQITENNADCPIPTSKKKRKRDNLDLQNEDETLKKKNKRIKLENSIQEDSNTDEIDTSLKKKKKKVKIEETVDNIDLNLNESIHKKKKKQKSEENGPEESVNKDVSLNESNNKKKKKHKEEIKIEETSNKIQEVVTKKKKSELKEESTGASKLNLKEETTKTSELILNESTSKKKKRKSKENNIQENINGLSSEILMRPTEMIKEIIEKTPKKNRKSNEHKRRDSSVLHTPTVMADLEDRKHKKLNSSKNILWDNVELNLYDSELEQTLKEKVDKSSTFNLVKISALNEGNDVEKKSEEKKKKKRKSDEEMETKIKKEKLIFEDESTEQNIKKKSKTKKLKQ